MAIRKINKFYRVSGKVASLFKGGGYIVGPNGVKTKFYSDEYKFIEVGSTVALFGDFVFDRQFRGDTFRVDHFNVVQSAAVNSRLERQMESSDKMAASFISDADLTLLTLPEGADIIIRDGSFLTLSEGVTRVGNIKLLGGSSLTLPEGVTEVGDIGLFDRSSLTLSKGLTQVGGLYVVLCGGCSITFPDGYMLKNSGRGILEYSAKEMNRLLSEHQKFLEKEKPTSMQVSESKEPVSKSMVEQTIDPEGYQDKMAASFESLDIDYADYVDVDVDVDGHIISDADNSPEMSKEKQLLSEKVVVPKKEPAGREFFTVSPEDSYLFDRPGRLSKDFYISGHSSLTLPEGVTQVSYEDSSLTFPNEVTKVGSIRLGYNSSLILPEGVTKVGHISLSGSASLTLPKSLTHLRGLTIDPSASLIFPDGYVLKNSGSGILEYSAQEMNRLLFKHQDGMGDPVCIPKGTSYYVFPEDVEKGNVPPGVGIWVSPGGKKYLKFSDHSKRMVPEEGLILTKRHDRINTYDVRELRDYREAILVSYFKADRIKELVEASREPGYYGPAVWNYGIDFKVDGWDEFKGLRYAFFNNHIVCHVLKNDGSSVPLSNVASVKWVEILSRFEAEQLNRKWSAEEINQLVSDRQRFLEKEKKPVNRGLAGREFFIVSLEDVRNGTLPPAVEVFHYKEPCIRCSSCNYVVPEDGLFLVKTHDRTNTYNVCTKKQFDLMYKVGKDGLAIDRRELKPGVRQRKGMQLK